MVKYFVLLICFLCLLMSCSKESSIPYVKVQIDNKDIIFNLTSSFYKKVQINENEDSVYLLKVSGISNKGEGIAIELRAKTIIAGSYTFNHTSDSIFYVNAEFSSGDYLFSVHQLSGTVDPGVIQISSIGEGSVKGTFNFSARAINTIDSTITVSKGEFSVQFE